MKELKFRFVDTGDGTVYKPITLKELCLRIELPRRVVLESENGDFVDTDDFLDLLEKDELIAEQHTWYKDKNGKEICEGDIVECKFVYDKRYKCRGLVIKREDKACYAIKDIFGLTDEEVELYRLTAQRNLEVIGNIHENPELLEGK